MRAKRKNLIKLIVMLLVVAVLGTLSLTGLQIGIYRVKPLPEAIKQGLDLRGGVYALYQANDGEEDLQNKLSGAMSVLRNRLDSSGYTEATVTQQGTSRIRVEVPDVDDPEEILDIIGKPAKLEFVDPNNETILTGQDIKKAEPAISDGSQWVVNFELNESGTEVFAKATEEFKGQVIKIVLDGETISSPVVEAVIATGSGSITGNMDAESAKELAMLIQSGSLPLELNQVEVRSISATLGESALARSLQAGLIGLIILMLFMLVYYRLPGLMANISLCVYMLIMLVLLATIPSVQLTLPGIAGIILSIGMAVDANVIIFERFKEELRLGKTLTSALSSGFSKAFGAIFDSNLTTLIAAVVLMFFGTGTIKGFAITLLLGILTSMFTAIVVTRFLMRIAVGLNITNRSLYLAGAKKAAAKEAK
ncbi:protein translocase subunit SecD [Christensenellaceae bacterium NSJ-44]|uniref:Protein translocase subunit SecD n=1 Tax=Luoshenia tenuis TaxID=2763654 RepID=A0A926D0M0_9FIRM|nr:protein translocase subunit SecD [Luoshenia tenuis]MBC8529048.1 protein translocase subunit SecD [Luoshenia tenuis]